MTINKILAGRTGYLIAFVKCFALVGLALWIQTHYKLEPCPLCISQRILFMTLGALFLLAAFVKSDGLVSTALTILQLLTALGGTGVAIRHWYLQANKESMIADCGVGFDYMFENFPLKKALTLVFRGTGDCAAIDWTFLGLTLPQLSLIAFIGFGLFAIYLAALNRK